MHTWKYTIKADLLTYCNHCSTPYILVETVFHLLQYILQKKYSGTASFTVYLELKCTLVSQMSVSTYYFTIDLISTWYTAFSS